ncbi:MAG TPA: hypothetical protein VMM38_15740 [Aridibacter sp.]|nr:hypothetical protein [Aridibacter sp.]
MNGASRFSYSRLARMAKLIAFCGLASTFACSALPGGNDAVSNETGGQERSERAGETARSQNGVGKDSPCFNEYYPLTPDIVRRYGVFTGKTEESEDYSDPPTTYLKKQDYSGESSFTEFLEFSNGIEHTVKWNCAPEGLRNDEFIGYLKGPNSSNEVEVVSSSGVYMPREDWRVGAKWSYEIKVKIKSGASGGGDITNDARIDYEIISLDDRVKVPGGEFTAARLSSVSNMEVVIPGRPNTPVKLTNSEWYSPEVGLVKLLQTGFNTATTVYLGDEKK